jgi:hypothetical protein
MADKRRRHVRKQAKVRKGRKNPMALLIPRHLLDASAWTPAAPFFGVCYGMHDITGHRATPALLIQKLSRFKRSDVIRWIASLVGWNSDIQSLNPSNQIAMADSLLRTELRDLLREHVRKEGVDTWCVFHRRQLWFILQMALLSCSENSAEQEDNILKKEIGEACLMASDVLHDVERREPFQGGADGANRWITGVVVPILDGRDQMEVLARAQSFWFDLPAGSSVRARFKKLNAPDFDTAFMAKYGVPLRDFFLILFCLHSAFRVNGQRSNGPLLLEAANYFASTFDSKHVACVLSNVSITPDELAIALLSTPRQNWATDSTPLRVHPVIQVFESKYACSDVNLLYRSIFDKLYFLLQKACSDKTFAQLVGYIFEEYVNDLLRRFSYEGDSLVRTFYAAPHFDGTQDEAGDGILAWTDAALVMEYKSRLLTTREKYCGVTDVLLAGVDDIIGNERNKKGVYQLAKVIERVLSGEKIVAGSPKRLDLSACPRVFPVMVTLEPTLGLESVRQQAQAKFTSMLQVGEEGRKRIGELLILTIEDIEILEGLASRHSAHEVVRDYASYVAAHPNDLAGSFRSFVYSSEYNKNPTPPPETGVGQLCSRAMETIRVELEKRSADISARTGAAVDPQSA